MGLRIIENLESLAILEFLPTRDEEGREVVDKIGSAAIYFEYSDEPGGVAKIIVSLSYWRAGWRKSPTDYAYVTSKCSQCLFIDGRLVPADSYASVDINAGKLINWYEVEEAVGDKLKEVFGGQE